MLNLLAEFEKKKKRTLLIVLFLFLGFVSCCIAVVISTASYQGLIKAYYPSSLAPIYHELTFLEFLWMIFILLSFFFMNTSIWYYISYDLHKKSIITLTFAEKNGLTNPICYKCGIGRSSNSISKNGIQGVKHIKFFNVKGQFCRNCSRRFLRISLGTIMLIPIIYFLCISLIVPILMGINLSYIPESSYYLSLTILPVFILTILIVIIYALYNKIKISKLYVNT